MPSDAPHGTPHTKPKPFVWIRTADDTVTRERRALETTPEKCLASLAPATAADVNPLSGSLSLVAAPRLSSTRRWYVTADPGEIDGVEFANPSGAEGPQVESRSGRCLDGVEIRMNLDFGAGFIDHRGWIMNAVA